MNTYNVLKSILNMIEDNISSQLTIEDIASNNGISSVHLQRIFKYAFGIPIAGYIRSRKMAVSLEKLIFTNLKVIDIANEFGFDHEQSYIRAFRQEFNITPGQLRKTKSIVKTTPRLNLSNTVQLTNGVLFQPEIVIVPEFYLVGKLNYPDAGSNVMAAQLAKDFWDNDRMKIKNVISCDIYYGLTRTDKMLGDGLYYLSAVQTKSLDKIPKGFAADTFPSSKCVKFSYIGNHHYYEINRETACAMYEAIDKFFQTKPAYIQSGENIFFEKVDASKYNEGYCFMEWFTPVKIK